MDLLVVSADNKVVCRTETTYQAQFIVQACNNFESLLEACRIASNNLSYEENDVAWRAVEAAITRVEAKS
jgi:hypothetical protein